MDTSKVSIILPTYNVFPYLSQCLDSILAQTYKNIEVIIIIDGATDGSYELAKKYSQKDKRVSVYWQENSGSGSARNNGLEHAAGDYVMFVDPDDWCKNNYVETMVDLITSGGYDLVTTKEISVYFDNRGKQTSMVEYHIDNYVIDNEFEVRKQYVDLLSKGLVSAPHCKIYKNSIIRKYNIRFPDLRRSQDVVFNYRYYNYINKIRVSNYSGYLYRVLRKDRVLRLSPEYYKTVKTLYSEIVALHKKWNIAFDKVKACTDFYVSIQAHFEANILRKIPIKYIVEDAVINEIIRTAKPQKKHFVLTRWLVLHKFYRSATFLILILYYIKTIIH